MFVPDIENVQRIFNLLDQFKTCSGLQVNYKKTEAMWIGSCRNNTAAPLGQRRTFHLSQDALRQTILSKSCDHVVISFQHGCVA